MWLTSEIYQTSHPGCRYQPNRYHLTPPIVKRRSSDTLRVCCIERGTWPCKLDETTDELCHGVSKPEAEDQAQRGPDGRKRWRLFRAIWGVLQGGGEAGHSGCFVALTLFYYIGISGFSRSFPGLGFWLTKITRSKLWTLSHFPRLVTKSTNFPLLPWLLLKQSLRLRAMPQRTKPPQQVEQRLLLPHSPRRTHRTTSPHSLAGSPTKSSMTPSKHGSRGK